MIQPGNLVTVQLEAPGAYYGIVTAVHEADVEVFLANGLRGRVSKACLRQLGLTTCADPPASAPATFHELFIPPQIPIAPKGVQPLMWMHKAGEDKCSCEFPRVWIAFPFECQNCMKLLRDDR